MNTGTFVFRSIAAFASYVALLPLASQAFALQPITSVTQAHITVQVRGPNGGPVQGNQYCMYANGRYAFAPGVQVVGYTPGPQILTVDGRAFDINGAMRIDADAGTGLARQDTRQGFNSIQFTMSSDTNPGYFEGGWITTPPASATDGYISSLNVGKTISETTPYVFTADTTLAIATSNVHIETNAANQPQLRLINRVWGQLKTNSNTLQTIALFGVNANELAGCDQRISPPIIPSAAGKAWTFQNPVNKVDAFIATLPAIALSSSGDIARGNNAHRSECADTPSYDWGKQFIFGDGCASNYGATHSLTYGQYYLNGMNLKFLTLFEPTNVVSAAQKRANAIAIVTHGHDIYRFWQAARNVGGVDFVQGNGGHNTIMASSAFAGIIMADPTLIDTSYARTGMHGPASDQYVTVPGTNEIAFRHNDGMTAPESWIRASQFSPQYTGPLPPHSEYLMCCTVMTRSTTTSIINFWKHLGYMELWDPTGAERKLTEEYGRVRWNASVGGFDTNAARWYWQALHNAGQSFWTPSAP